MKRLRLLKVSVQPTFVVDDGETLTEVTGPPMAVTGSDWPRFASESFTVDDLAALLATSDFGELEPGEQGDKGP